MRITYQWTEIITQDGEVKHVMEPLGQFKPSAEELFVQGELYDLDEYQERNAESHKHYFSCINEIHRNLPEDMKQRFPTPRRMRQWALVMAGYSHESHFYGDSHEDALYVAADFFRINSNIHTFAIIVVEGRNVTRATAKSQSYKSMGRKEFMASKRDTLAYLSKRLNMDLVEVERQARSRA